MSFSIQKSNFIISTKAFFEAVIYTFKNRWVWSYLFFAIFLNLLIFTLLTIFLFIVSDTITNIITSNFQENILIQGLDFILQIVLWFVLIFFLNMIFNSLSSIINAPIYSVLTEKIIEKELPNINFPDSNISREIFIALNFEIKKFILALIFLILSFVLNLIPFVGSLVFVILNLIQMIFITGLDAFEPYHSLKKLRFRARLLEITKKFSLYSPFLLICGLIASLPIVNIFLNPISIIGASIISKKCLIGTK